MTHAVRFNVLPFDNGESSTHDKKHGRTMIMEAIVRYDGADWARNDGSVRVVVIVWHPRCDGTSGSWLPRPMIGWRLIQWRRHRVCLMTLVTQWNVISYLPEGSKQITQNRHNSYLEPESAAGTIFDYNRWLSETTFNQAFHYVFLKLIKTKIYIYFLVFKLTALCYESSKLNHKCR